MAEGDTFQSRIKGAEDQLDRLLVACDGYVSYSTGELARHNARSNVLAYLLGALQAKAECGEPITGDYLADMFERGVAYVLNEVPPSIITEGATA